MDNILMYNFDAVPTADRYNFTKQLIYETKGVGLVIIDGIADLVKSVNDEIIACDTADSLRRWATECDVAIGYVLHQNPSDSSKMRGHLGTILMNKSETVIQISSAKDNDSIKLVETLQTRNAKPEAWSFEIIDGLPTIQDVLFEENKGGRPKVKKLNDTERMSLLNEVYTNENKTNGFPYSVLTERIREVYTEKYGNIGACSIKEFITYCKDMNFICQDVPRGNYMKQPSIL